MMRETFGYHHYKQFKDVAILQEVFNHAAPSITRRYIGLRGTAGMKGGLFMPGANPAGTGGREKVRMTEVLKPGFQPPEAEAIQHAMLVGGPSGDDEMGVVLPRRAFSL